MKRILIITASLLAVTVSQAQTLSLSLNDCMSMSSQNDPYVRGAALDVLAAEAQKQEVFAEFFPRLSASALAFHSMNPLIDLGLTDLIGHSDYAHELNNAYKDFAAQNGLPQRYKALQYGSGVTMSAMQPLYTGGRIVNGNRLARLGIEAARLKQRISMNTNLGQVEQKYWQVVSLGEKLKTLEQAEEMLKALGSDAGAAFSAGLLTDSEMLQVRLKTNELRSLRMKASSGMRLAKMDLFNAIGQPYCFVRELATADRPFLDDISLSETLDSLLPPDSYYVPEEQMAASMAETRLLELQVEAKTLEKKLAMGEALPQVAVGASAGYARYIGDPKMNAGVYAMVQVPISDWGKTSRKMKRLDYDLQKTAIEKEYLDAQLLLRARQLWIQLTTAWEQLQVAKESVELSEEALRKATNSLESGMITISDLLQVQTTLRHSEDAYIDQCIAYRTALREYLSPGTAI